MTRIDPTARTVYRAMKAPLRESESQHPCAEIRAWYAERLRPRLVAAAHRGDIDPTAVAQLELDMRALVESSAPCRDRSS